MSWMIDEKDPARNEIAARADALGITGDPDQAAHALGSITLANGREVQAHVLHAVDAVITDGRSVVMINRLHAPGQGLPALPGGLIDPTAEGIESAVQAAAREALEEVGVILEKGTRVGTRNMNRPQDVRVAQGNGLEKNYGVKDGDIFMVSTQAIRFDVPDLSQTHLIAGDDAEPGSARRIDINTITKDNVGIADHADMIHEAMAMHPPYQKLNAVLENNGMS